MGEEEARRRWAEEVGESRTLMMQLESAERLALSADAHVPAHALSEAALSSGPPAAAARLLTKLARRGHAPSAVSALPSHPSSAPSTLNHIADLTAIRRLASAAPSFVAPSLSTTSSSSLASNPPSHAPSCALLAHNLPPESLSSSASSAASQLALSEHTPYISLRLATFLAHALGCDGTDGASLGDSTISDTMQAVSLRLSSSDPYQHAIAKAIGNLAAARLAPERDPPFADDDDTRHALHALRHGSWSHSLEGDASRMHNAAADDVSNNDNDFNDIGDVDDGEEDESLPAYELEEGEGEPEDDDELDRQEAEEGPPPASLLSKRRGASWIGELVDELAKVDDPDAVEHALDDAQGVIRSSGPELSEYGKRLLSTLIRARPASPNEEQIASRRLKALASVMYSSPLDLPEHLLELALGEDHGLDQSQRVECLCSIPPALVQLSQGDSNQSTSGSSEADRLPRSSSDESNADAETPAALRTVGRTIRASEKSLHRWRRERAQEASSDDAQPTQSARYVRVNAVSHVAPRFLIPLLDKLRKASLSNPCISEPSVLSRALQVSAVIHATAGHSPHRRDLAFVTLEALNDERLMQRAEDDVHVRRIYWHLALECVGNLSRGELEGMLEETTSDAPRLLRSLHARAKAMARRSTNREDGEVINLAITCARSLKATAGSLTDAAFMLSGGEKPGSVPSDVPSALRICI